MIAIDDKVVVTTEYRGVFFGRLTEYDREARLATLVEARNCVYWPLENRGFLGLASDGPLEGARVGPAAPILELAGVTSVTKCDESAVARWEAGPWS